MLNLTLYITETNKQIKEAALLIYHEILSSIANGIVLDWPTLVEICEAVDFTVVDYLNVLGYVKVEKMTSDDGKPLLHIQEEYLDAIPQLFKRPFHIQNGIGILQCSNGAEDSYKGQLLLPLQHGKDDEKWLCIEYEC